MTQTPNRLPPRFSDRIPEMLAAAGKTPREVEALIALDQALYYWHRRVMKGEVPGHLIRELGADLELTQFHALTAISRIEAGVGRDQPEPATIGLLADEMNVDPSRASRIASDLIGRGYVERAAVQDDGRKSVLRLTAKAVETFVRFKDLKWAKMLDVMQGWSEEDVTCFSRLLRRYVEDTSRVYPG